MQQQKLSNHDDERDIGECESEELHKKFKRLPPPRCSLNFAPSTKPMRACGSCV